MQRRAATSALARLLTVYVYCECDIRLHTYRAELKLRVTTKLQLFMRDQLRRTPCHQRIRARQTHGMERPFSKVHARSKRKQQDFLPIGQANMWPVFNKQLRIYFISFLEITSIYYLQLY